MKEGTAQKFSNALLSGAAGFASFVFSLAAFLYITEFNGKILASIIAGAFCLLISYVASERPNSENARALCGARRPPARGRGRRPRVAAAPALVHKAMPKHRRRRGHFVRRSSRVDRERPCAGHVRPGDVAAQPSAFPLGSRQIAWRDVAPAARSAMLFVDLDRFKLVNDSLGHARGDQLLIMVANRLRVIVSAEFGGSVKRRPLLARLAGDEFTLFFPDIKSSSDIERVARRVALAIGEPFELCGHSVDIGASIGVSICPDHGSSIESLMRAADIAMYHAKSNGGGRHCLFDERIGGRTSAESGNRAGAHRSGPAQRVPARLPAPAEPGDGRDCREPRRCCAGTIHATVCGCHRPLFRSPKRPG